jgi:hypothetical protein
VLGALRTSRLFASTRVWLALPFPSSFPVAARLSAAFFFLSFFLLPRASSLLYRLRRRIGPLRCEPTKGQRWSQDEKSRGFPSRPPLRCSTEPCFVCVCDLPMNNNFSTSSTSPSAAPNDVDTAPLWALLTVPPNQHERARFTAAPLLCVPCSLCASLCWWLRGLCGETASPRFGQAKARNQSSSSSSSRQQTGQNHRGTHHHAKGSTQGSTGSVRGRCYLTLRRLSACLFHCSASESPCPFLVAPHAQRRWSGPTYRRRQQAGAVGVPLPPLSFVSWSPPFLPSRFPLLPVRRRRPSAPCRCGCCSRRRGANQGGGSARSALDFAYTGAR